MTSIYKQEELLRQLTAPISTRITPKPLLKEDTTYYNDPHKKYLDIFPNVNPAYDDQYLNVFGRLTRNDLAVNEKFVQDDAIISQGNSNVNDDLRMGFGTSWAVPYIKKAKIFQFGMELKHLDYLAYMGGGNAQLNARVASELETDANLYRYTLMEWMTGYTTTTTNLTGYDPDWVFPFAYPASGTVTAPCMIQEHASCGNAGETVRDQTAAIMTNDFDAAKTKDFVNNTFGKAIMEFSYIRNTSTGQQMLKPSGNTFAVFTHPQTIYCLMTNHPYNGVQDDENTTYFEQATKLGIQFVPCYNVDASFANTQDGTVPYVIVANPQDNIKIGWVSDYTVGPWESTIDNTGIKHWYKHAWSKAFAWVRPFTVDYGTTWYKAVGHYNFKYAS